MIDTITRKRRENTFRVKGDLSSVKDLALVDIWDYNVSLGNYKYVNYTNGNQPQGVDIFISSSNAGDTHTLRVIGLGPDGKYQEEDKNLVGQTKTKLSKQFFRVFRAINISDTDLTGDAYVYVDTAVVAGIPTDKSDILAALLLENQVSMNSMFTVPWDMKGYVKSIFVAIKELVITKGIAFYVFVRSPGGLFHQELGIPCVNSGSGAFLRTYDNHPNDVNHDFPLGPGDDIVIKSSTNAAGNGCTFEYVIKLAWL